MGIVANVNLHETKQGDYIEIAVEPQPNPVNYKGEYHFRSGSTKQELKGAALDKFLLQKYGRKWDSVQIPNVLVSELRQSTFSFFIEKAIVSYKGLSRIETYEYPEEALREALLNTVTHKDYAGCTPIQIRVYSDRIKIWNEGQLPENWTVKNLFQEHSSRPYNPDIANTFFRCGYVESWGRGIDKITEQCAKSGLPMPLITNEGSDFWVVFRKDIFNKDYLSLLGLSDRQIDAVLFFKAKGQITSSEYAERYKVTDRTARTDLTGLVEKEVLVKQGETKLAVYIFPQGV